MEAIDVVNRIVGYSTEYEYINQDFDVDSRCRVASYRIVSSRQIVIIGGTPSQLESIGDGWSTRCSREAVEQSWSDVSVQLRLMRKRQTSGLPYLVTEQLLKSGLQCCLVRLRATSGTLGPAVPCETVDRAGLMVSPAFEPSHLYFVL